MWIVGQILFNSIQNNVQPFQFLNLFQIRPSAWRYSVPAVFLPGESWNVEEYDVKNVISYDGETGEGIGQKCGAPFPGHEAIGTHPLMMANSPLEGPLASGETRTHPHARAMFANGDTFFGGYSEDLKSGPGIYLFAAGVGADGPAGQGPVLPNLNVS